MISMYQSYDMSLNLFLNESTIDYTDRITSYTEGRGSDPGLS